MPAITSKSCPIRFSERTSSKGACTWKSLAECEPSVLYVGIPQPIGVAGLNEDRSRSELQAALADLNSNGGGVCPLAGKQRRDDNKKCNAASARIHSLTSIDVTLLLLFLERKQRHRFLSSWAVTVKLASQKKPARNHQRGLTEY